MLHDIGRLMVGSRAPTGDEASRGLAPLPRPSEATLLAELPAARRRALGCWMTPAPVARLMARLVAPSLAPGSRVLDPAVGSGRLLSALVEVVGLPALGMHLLGVEREPALAAWTRTELTGVAEVSEGDALALLDPARRRALWGAERVDAVVANPPYVREKGHRRIFDERVRWAPLWRPFTAPRGDLQQLFLVLGSEILAPGGELVFLVNPYWLQSDSGRVVRDHLAARLTWLQVVDFGEQRLFREAPGQHHLLVHARRREDDEAPSPGASPPRTRYLRVTERWRPADATGGLAALSGAIGEALAGGAVAPGLEVRVGGPPRAVGPRRRWYLPHARDAALARLEADSLPLGALFETHQGVVSGADRVTRRNRGHLTEPAALGAGIFLLTGEEVAELGLSPAERRLLRRVYRGREVHPFEVRSGAPLWVLYLAGQVPIEELPGIRRHLARFRPLLARRRECRSGLMPWWRLHWPRDRRLFDRPRLITPRRAPTPRFALAPAGSCEQSDLAIVTTGDDDAEWLRSLSVVLNSGVMTAWCRLRGKHKGGVREFFGRPLEELPLPRAAREDPAAFRALARYAHPGRAAAAEPLVAALYGEGARRLLDGGAMGPGVSAGGPRATPAHPNHPDLAGRVAPEQPS